MNIVKTINELRERIDDCKKKNKSVGFVPTMGFLHEGHLRLIKQAREANDIVVLSIFVNPLQFGPNEDFERYPRDFKRDERLAREAGVDVLFYPTVTEMYPKEPMMTIHVTQGVDVLCGASRPGHFDGVTTVVMKLFQIVLPDRAYFGLKDAQQVAIIMNMVETFNVPIDVVACETVREDDGLAKSSRNVYLSVDERQAAPLLYQALQKTKAYIENHFCTRTEGMTFLYEQLSEQPIGAIDYIDILSYPRLERVNELTGTIIIALAYRYEHARLIDNLLLNVQKKGV
ncbi:pantoate--beta-alanine ligase [Bacillus solitudinis]|uniref:pantoate--beta-alanine ligase n=1 Tax=Bacillus solitudinis TaxID=2014074 RepID=UPI000C234469|nr:pantoate--beta-alanine ligase [Bacillus solitudinis]